MSALDLIAEASSELSGQRSKAYARYAKLLQAKGPATPAVAEEFRKLLKELGKSPADAHQDLTTLSRAVDYRRQIVDGSDLEDERAKAEDAVRESSEHIRAELERMQIAHNEKVAASSQLQDRISLADRAGHSLNDLKREHPLLLADV